LRSIYAEAFPFPRHKDWRLSTPGNLDPARQSLRGDFVPVVKTPCSANPAIDTHPDATGTGY
ncbi:MAG: hypothetical protein J4O08_09380, partial [Chloroflexi bacterium]|nr:hypothetical protein [Chloroflexota bacterium]